MNGAQYIEFLKKQCGWEDLNKIDQDLNHIKDTERVIEILKLDEDEIERLPQNLRKSNEFITSDLEKGILKSMQEIGFPIHVAPVIGILPIMDYNAWATQAPNGDPVCVLDFGLFITIGTLAGCLGEATILNTEGQTGDIPFALQMFSAVCLDFLGLADDSTKLFLIENKIPRRIHSSCYQILFSSLLGEAITAFILAHEYSHHALGHFDNTMLTKISGPKGEASIEIYMRSQSQEINADVLGCKAFLAYARSPNSDSTRHLDPVFEFAPVVFCDFLDFIETYILKEINNDTSASHPSGKTRSEKLKKICSALASKESKMWYQHENSFFKLVRKMKSKFWSS